MGRLTPVTTSTFSWPRNVDAMLVGVPPNMSVRMRTPSGVRTRSSALRIIVAAVSTSSCHPRDTAAIPWISPTIISAALSSSIASLPWVTIRPPTMGKIIQGGARKIGVRLLEPQTPDDIYQCPTMFDLAAGNLISDEWDTSKPKLQNLRLDGLILKIAGPIQIL